MGLAARFGGLGISICCHLLLLLIPLSLATQAPRKNYPPVEMVMTLAPLPMEPAPQPAAPPRPEPPKPKVVPKPRPQPRPVVTEPVEAKTFIPQPVAPPQPAVAKAPPRPSAGSGTPGPPGPVVADFGSASGPAFLRRVLPVYPEMAKRLGKEGRVVLRLHLDARGNLQRVEVVEGAGYGFEEAAIAAVKQSSFRPAMVQGEPRACIARLPIKFALKN